MDSATLTSLGLRAGLWEARIAAPGEAPPEIEVTHRGAPLEGVELSLDGPGSWLLRVPVPAELLSDGVQTILVSERGSGTRIGGFSIVAGEPVEADLRAEIELLRAELDMLKKAFRRLASGGG